VLQFKADNFDYANCGDLSPDGRFVATKSGGQDEPGAPHKDCFVHIWHSMTSHKIARIPHEYLLTDLRSLRGAAASLLPVSTENYVIGRYRN